MSGIFSAESVNEILAAFKEQKDITIFLEDAVGKLRTKQAMLIKQREDLQARRNASHPAVICV